MADPKLEPWRDPSHPKNGSSWHTGKKCVEGCGRPAGTGWSPYWCFQCNVERMERISRVMEATKRRLEAHHG